MVEHTPEFLEGVLAFKRRNKRCPYASGQGRNRSIKRVDWWKGYYHARTGHRLHNTFLRNHIQWDLP